VNNTAAIEQSAPARSLHPRVRLVWWIGSLGSDLVAITVLSVLTLILAANTEITLPDWWVMVPVGLAVLSVAVRTWYVNAAYRVWRYRFGAESLEIRYGVFWKRTSSMPYHRLQQVDVGQGPLERWLGMSTVQLRSAAATTDATIPGIADEEVGEIRTRLMQRAGRDDGT
jgi:membrane protein YdbS with pleckstrin-like domain